MLGAATGEGNLAVLLGSTTGTRRHRRRERAGLGRLRADGDGGTGQTPTTTPSGPACRWATPSRRSGSSRPVSSCSTGVWWWGSRTSAAPGSPVPRRRPRVAAAWAWTSHVDVVPRREPAMAPFEVMTSESQERMLAIVTPADRDAVEEVCRRWEVRATVIGTVTGRRAPAHPRRRRRRCWPTSPPPRSPTTPRSTTAPGRLPPISTARRRDDPGRGAGRARRPRTSLGADVLAPARRRVVGLPPVRPPALPQHRRRARRGRRRAAPGRAGPAAQPSGASPSPPTPTRGGAPSTPAGARP